MLRDLKFLRRNSGKNGNLEEVENVPVDPRDSMGSHNVPASFDSSSSRPPFSTIQEPFSKLKSGRTDPDVVGKAGKIDKTTPTKPKINSMLPRRTPEKQGKNQFGWAQKNDSCSSNAMEVNDEGRSDMRAVISNITPRSMKTDLRRANSGYSDCHSTQSTPTKSVSKPPNPVQCLTGGSRPLASGGARMPNFAALSKGIPASCNSVAVVNTVEVPHFELKEDPSFWMEHNVQVLIRVRPLNNAEKSTYGYNRCLKQESAQCITWIGQPESRFTFDHVACETIDQETLFRMVGLPMVENCLSGYNSCMFAYGQTGSGKTYTMLGDIEQLEIKPSSNRGMTPRIFEFLFARIRAEEESRKDERLRYHCKCSFLEIYNEQITDLLDPSSTNLMLREDIKKGVYVENLSEFDVQTVADVLKLLRAGSSNRKVAATNMNRESSRSHSVFTCVVECEWEKDSTSNFRFARLNLVDLAGSERQKTSGAEGDRLKEAANINKSLSTLGHVIMVLVDLANGRPKHVPYRDSRLTFLLQDSLGGNSKTMIIANVSPSVCSAAETLNTLKFAQRAKLIQNNAFVNEDSSGDVLTLKNQIQLLKEELSLLKRQNVARSLSFGPTAISRTEEHDEHSRTATDETKDCAYTNGKECSSSLMLSTKQLKSLEITLAGALRREKMTETSIKQLEAEIEQLNRLVRQREEDSRCTKMMLKFREDKIQRMESLVGGLIPSDGYLMEENNALTSEIQLLQAKLEKNPEVTRFALENIRLLEQLRRFQDFYEEGEREMLLAEISELRDQLYLFLDGHLKHLNHPDVKSSPEEVINVMKENDSLKLEFKRTQSELEECRSKLSSCMEDNAKLQGDIEELRAFMTRTSSGIHDHASTAEVIKEPISEAPYLNSHAVPDATEETNEAWNKDVNLLHEESLHLQLELDILKAILTEERLSRSDVEKNSKSLSLKLELSHKEASLLNEQCESVQKQLDEAKSIIDALESQQLLAINEIEDLKNSNSQYTELLQKKEVELSSFKNSLYRESRSLPKGTEHGNSPLQENLNKMHKSLEKAKRLNQRYQHDKVFQASNEEEMDEVRRQVEAETAEVIVCLQEELAILQHEFQASSLKETETSNNLAKSQAEIKRMEEHLSILNQENLKLNEKLQDKEEDARKLSEEWALLTSDVEAALANGHDSLEEASDQLEIISKSYPQKRRWISEHVAKLTKNIVEKDSLVEELNQCLEDVFVKKTEMESMLRSLKGAAAVMTEAHLEECKEKDNNIALLTSQLAAEASIVSNLRNKLHHRENHLKEITICTMAVSVALSRLSELNAQHLGEIKALAAKLAENEELCLKKDAVIQHQAVEAEKQTLSLQRDIETLQKSCSGLRMQIHEEQMHANALKEQMEEREEADILKAEEKLTELKNGVSAVRSCMKDYTEGIGSSACFPSDETGDATTGVERKEASRCMKSPDYPTDAEEKSDGNRRDQNEFNCPRKPIGGSIRRDATINLLKKEIESALESLKGVQAEMGRLHDEKDLLRVSETESRRCIECITNQGFNLQTAMDKFEVELKMKMEVLDGKLKGFEEFVHSSGGTSWFLKELLEAELSDAKVVAVQKATEAACVVAKFDEVHDTLKEAETMINELVIANKALKRDIKKIKEQETLSTNNCNVLSETVKSLQSMNDLKEQCNQELEKQSESDTETMKYFMQELETMTSQVKETSMEGFMLLASDCLAVKSQVDGAMKLMKSCLEDIWSEIIMKDSAVSVLHLCHIGILLETVTGLNAENNFLHHGVDESNTVISELQEHNIRSKRELERCRILEGKLLADIKNSFDRISRHEHETAEVSVKLNTFDQKILDLQRQEELMLERSNSMGSELSALMADVDLGNKRLVSSLLDQERLLKEKEEIFNSQEEDFIMNLSARDFELLIMSCKLKELGTAQANLEEIREVAELFKKETILCSIDARLRESILEETQIEHSFVLDKLETSELEKLALLSEIKKKNSKIAQMDESHKARLVDFQALKEAESKNDHLKSNLEAALEHSSRRISTLEQQNETLQTSNSLLENALQSEMGKAETENCLLSQDLEDKKAKLESLFRRVEDLDVENQTLRANICALEEHILNMQSDLDIAKAELNDVQLSKSMITNDLQLKEQDLQIQVDEVHSLQEVNASLRNELMQNLQDKGECLNALSLNLMKCADSVEHMRATGSKICNFVSEDSKCTDTLLKEVLVEFERIVHFMDDFEHMEKLAKDLASETVTLQTELFRKDELLNGLLFDMRLLQESASNSKDHKDVVESLNASVGALEEELKSKSACLEEAIAKGEKLEAELQERTVMLSSLESDIEKERETVRFLSSKTFELTESNKGVEEAKEAVEEELADERLVNESLEKEISEMGSALDEMSFTVKLLENSLNNVSNERDDLHERLLTLTKELEIERDLAEEKGVQLAEAREESELLKSQFENKEEEVKLLERSIQELECTVNALEDKVDILIEEAEKQRLQREELETELEAVKQQMHSVQIYDADVKRKLTDKEKSLQESLKRVEILEIELAERDAEIARCKSHIAEVNLHAEAQASEYKQKFKGLEAMLEQVKQDMPAIHGSNSSANKMEKTSTKSRGSGSPFKCIGLGLQMKSEKEEELSAGRHRLEELEALANSRQKEIFMLKARLATSESMTHDVLRDLLGVKLDMNSCATLVNTQKLRTLTQKAQHENIESQFKDEEIDMLKQQLNALNNERKGWLEEIDRKQAELIAAQVTMETLRQRDQMLQTQNEMIKTEVVNHKKRAMELEAEVRRLSGQQNIQQRIHHHAKIKEENNNLKNKNDELGVKLRKAEANLTRVREELAKYRAASGRIPCMDSDDEERLSKKLKETESERLQLAHELVSLCTSILKAAGITRSAQEINPTAAEEAIEQMKRRINKLETELLDAKHKNRINKEKELDRRR